MRKREPSSCYFRPGMRLNQGVSPAPVFNILTLRSWYFSLEAGIAPLSIAGPVYRDFLALASPKLPPPSHRHQNHSLVFAPPTSSRPTRSNSAKRYCFRRVGGLRTKVAILNRNQVFTFRQVPLGQFEAKTPTQPPLFIIHSATLTRLRTEIS